MFGALQFGQGYFAQGPPGLVTLEPLRPLSICDTSWYSLMSPRDAASLMGLRDAQSRMPVRGVGPFCEDES